MKLYHAAHPSYLAGSDLFSLGRMVDDGRLDDGELQALLARWTEAGEDYLFADGQLISFTTDREEALRIRADFNGGEGLLLVVESADLQAEGILTTNAEGYPAARGGKVPADLISLHD